MVLQEFDVSEFISPQPSPTPPDMEHYTDFTMLQNHPTDVRDRVERGRAYAATVVGAAITRATNMNHEEPAQEHLRLQVVDNWILHRARDETARDVLLCGGIYWPGDPVNTKWKSPLFYFNGDSSQKLVKFDMRDYSVMDYEWMEKVAGNKEVPISQRRDWLVRYLNNFWCFLNASEKGVLSKVPDENHKGHVRSSVSKVAAFKDSNNYRVSFALEDSISKEYLNSLVQIFGKSVPKGSYPSPTMKKPLGRPPKVPNPEQQRVELPSGPQFLQVNLTDLWFHHTMRRSATGMTYDPHPDDHKNAPSPNLINTWAGFRMTAGNTSNLYDVDAEATRRADFILTHIKDVICNGDEDCYKVELYSDAKMLQEPWERYDSLHILFGPEGVGKSMYMMALKEIVGPWQFKQTSNLDDVVGNFTDILAEVYLLYLNEAYNPNDTKADAALKILITEPEFRFRKMYWPTEHRKKFFKAKADSNERDVVHADPNSRRYMMIQCLYEVLSAEYFKELHDAMYADGMLGIRAFADYLYRMDLTTGDAQFHNGRKIVPTKRLMDQQMSSMDPLARVMLDCLTHGRTVVKGQVTDREDPQVKRHRDLWKIAIQDWVDAAKTWISATTKDGTDHLSETMLQRIADTELGCKTAIADLTEGDSWLTCVAMEDFMKLYKSQHNAYINRAKGGGCALMADEPVKERLKTMLGRGCVEFITIDEVKLVSSAQAEKAGADTSFNMTAKKAFLEHRPTRLYIKLPPLFMARANFKKAMGWKAEPWTSTRMDPKQLEQIDARIKKLNVPNQGTRRKDERPRPYEWMKADMQLVMEGSEPSQDCTIQPTKRARYEPPPSSPDWQMEEAEDFEEEDIDLE